MNPLQTKNYTAEAAVTKRRIIQYGAADGDVLLAAAAGNKFVGVSTDIDSAITKPVDVHVAGMVEIEFGATVTRGDQLTADSTGRAIAAVFDGSELVNVIGIAMVSGVVGDVALVFLALSRLAPSKVFLPFFIDETDLLAGTSQFIVSPVAGNVTKMVTTVKKAVTTGGPVTVEIGGTAVDGLAVVVADAAAVGDIDSDTPSSPTHASTIIAQDGAIEIVGDAAFATAGALNGYVEITL